MGMKPGALRPEMVVADGGDFSDKGKTVLVISPSFVASVRSMVNLLPE
jgi:hypothetical protein